MGERERERDRERQRERKRGAERDLSSRWETPGLIPLTSQTAEGGRTVLSVDPSLSREQ